jgi:hypothetical protein
MHISLLRVMLNPAGLPAAQAGSVFMRKSTRSNQKAYFHAPGRYRIERCRASCGPTGPTVLEPEALSARSDDEGAVTVLQGSVKDQAELAGILNSLYERHLSLLSVSYLH